MYLNIVKCSDCDEFLKLTATNEGLLEAAPCECSKIVFCSVHQGNELQVNYKNGSRFVEPCSDCIEDAILRSQTT